MNLRKRRGSSFVEYGLVGSLISIACLVSLVHFSSSLKLSFCQTSSSVKSAFYLLGSSHASDECDNAIFLSHMKLSGDYTLEDAYNACLSSQNGAGTSISGAGNMTSCVVHAEQVRYGGNGNLLLSSVGMSAIPAGLDQEDYNKANNDLIDQTNSYCQNSYSDPGLSLACEVSLQNAAQSENYSGSGWTPSNTIK